MEKPLAVNTSNSSEGGLQKSRMTPPRKKRVSSFGSPLLGGCGNETCRLMLRKSLHLHYLNEEDDHSSKDSTGNRPQGAEESEEGTVVSPELFAFMLKELEPERYPNLEQAISGQKMEAALARIKCEEPEEGRSQEDGGVLHVYQRLGASSSRAVRRG